jgi:hypothetical protein
MNIKQNRNNTLFILIVFVIVSMFCCKKTESSGVENTGLIALSNSLVVDLIKIVPSPDGGFVVGAKTWKHGNEDFWILKFNNKFDLQWERIVGGANDETLQQLAVNESNVVLAGGMSNGFGQDNVPSSQNKKDVPYFHCFDVNGNTLWEKSYVFSNWDFSSYRDKQKVTDIRVGSNGDFVIAARIGYTSPSPSGGVYVGLTGVVLKLNPADGNKKSTYILKIGSSPWINWDAVFETGNTYTVFWNWNLQGAGYVEIDKMDTGYLPYMDQKVATQWQWPNLDPIPGNIERLKNINDDGNLSYNYFFENEMYRYSYNRNTKNVSFENVTLFAKKIVSANSTFDNRFLLANAEGMVFETDPDLNILKSFKTNWKVKIPCKLFSGEYVLGIEISNSIYLVHYTKEGKIENEK